MMVRRQCEDKRDDTLLVGERDLALARNWHWKAKLGRGPGHRPLVQIPFFVKDKTQPQLKNYKYKLGSNIRQMS